MSETLPVTDAKRQLGALIDRIGRTREPVYVSRHGRRVAAIVDADEFERLRELAEDAEDAAAARAAREEMSRTGEQPIPWDEVRRELGLV